MEQYKTVLEGGTGEIIEKKSRFIATVRPVRNEGGGDSTGGDESGGDNTGGGDEGGNTGGDEGGDSTGGDAEE